MKHVFLMITIAILACGTSPSESNPEEYSGDRTPTNGDSLINSEVSFTWDAISGATTYYHQISTDESMQNPQESNSSSPSITLTPGSKGRWWWRVRAAVEGQHHYTEWTETWSFTLL